MKKFLIIQTAFLGDVILATSVAEKLHQYFPGSAIDFLLREGNEGLLGHHPFIRNVLVWKKNQNKLPNLLKIISGVRKEKYDHIINLHRFVSSGLITALSGAKEKIGFDKNPFSIFFSKKFKHEIGNGKHEIERNHELIRHLTDDTPAKPKLYPSEKETLKISVLKSQISNLKSYYCISPASVWFTKQFPKEKWIELINKLPEETTVFLLGSSADSALCEEIKYQISNLKSPNTFNESGQLSLLESAALMKDARMNYTNDSASLHLASAMNAPVTAVFCSTVPEFGFGPLSDQSKVVETKEKLDCRPCGIHGYKTCPKGHFKCAWKIDVDELL